jgi:SAM-dependent methyltransferase
MDGYHRFVFDPSRSEFVGRFEEMYRAEPDEHFDSWHQEDARNLVRRVCLALLADYNFDRVLDVGCGKGAFTHLLKKANNSVVAVDVSETALATARGRYPDVEFACIDVGRDPLPGDPALPFDLAVCIEALSYVEDWRRLLAVIARRTRRALIALYLPENPIGYVKSLDDLVAEFSRHFEIEEHIHFVPRRQTILLGASKHEST